MNVELTVGVYDGHDLVDTVPLSVPVDLWVSTLAETPADSRDLSFKIERLEVLF